MENKASAIRLTNKTAIALRKSALEVRRMWQIGAIVLSVALAGLAIYLGFRWLPAVPLLFGLTAGLAYAMYRHGRRVYLELLGQAICTEAAARGMREAKKEKARRKQAIGDLMAMQEDMQREAPPKSDMQDVSDVLGVSFSSESDTERPKTIPLRPLTMKRDTAEDGTLHRRRRQAGFEVIGNERAK